MNFIIFLFGLFWGSFLNILIDRLPKGETVLIGRSHCDFCKKPLRWYELIPLLSYLLQRGKCLRCRKKLSIQYPIIEFITGLGFALIYNSFYSRIGLLDYSFIGLLDYSIIRLFIYWIIFSCLLVIFVIDLKHQIIPDSMIIIGILSILILRILFHDSYFIIHDFSLISAFVSASISSMLFFILWLFTRGRGMGFGDVKLVFFLGLLTGYPLIILSLYIAFLTGAFVGVILIIARLKKMKSQIAFGPFLIAGAIITLIFQNTFLSWWKGII